MRRIIKFFDKLEDRVRGRLSHWPIVYALVGGAGIVLFWRGVWHTADAVAFILQSPATDSMGLWRPLTTSQILDGPISVLIGVVMLLMTGLFVSTFIGNEIIISGLRGEKKLAEKTEVEVKTETGAIGEIRSEIKKISERLEAIEKKLEAVKK